MKLNLLLAWIVVTLASGLLADIPRPPQRLKRIGFEVFADRQKGVDGEYGKMVDPQSLQLIGEALFVAGSLLLMGIMLAFELRSRRFPTQMWIVVLPFALVCLSSGGWIVMHCHRCLGDREPGWKYEREISDEERKSIDSSIESVLPDFKKAYDVEYDVLLSEGGLEMTDVRDRISCAPRPVYLRGSGNRRATMESVLQKNREMRTRCRGIPVEFLAERLEWRRPPLNASTYEDCGSCQGTGFGVGGSLCNRCDGFGVVGRRAASKEGRQ